MVYRRPFFPNPKPTRHQMLAKLDQGIDPSEVSTNRPPTNSKTNNSTNEDPSELVSNHVTVPSGVNYMTRSTGYQYPYMPRCLPTKGALQCIEEYPKFSAECIDQFINKRDVSFDEVEEYWIRNPLLDDENEDPEEVTETEVG